MPETADYEHVLDDEGVRGVSYEESDDTVVVLVAEKLPAEDLPDERLIANRIGGEVRTEVVGVGEISVGAPAEDQRLDESGTSPSADETPAPPVAPEAEAGTNARDRRRPPCGGVSEIRATSTAATAGMLAEVTDPDGAVAIWSDDVDAGDPVRVSNAHVYGGTEAAIGTPIVQPSPYDGGADPEDVVGETAGVVPLDDDVVDAAARTVDEEAGESIAAYGLGEIAGVHRGPWADLRGDRCTKTGRTTAVTQGQIRATDATVRIRYDGRTQTKRKQLILDDMSDGGDSGSPLVRGPRDEPGELVGHVYAGSDRVTVANRSSTIEQRLGVEFDVEPADHEPEYDIEDRLERYFAQAYGEDAVDRQYVFSSSRRRVDLAVDVGIATLVVEVEAGSAKMIEGLGQTLMYAAHDAEDDEKGAYLPFICMADGHFEQPERRYAAQYVSILTESEVMDRLGITEDDREALRNGTDPFAGDDQDPDADADAEGDH